MAQTSDFSLAEAQLVTLGMVSITYGIYLVSTGFCTYVLSRTEAGKRVRYHWQIAVVTVMFVLITMDVTLKFCQILEAFVWYKGTMTIEEYVEDSWPWMATVEVRANLPPSTILLTLLCGLIDREYSNTVHDRRWSAGEYRHACCCVFLILAKSMHYTTRFTDVTSSSREGL